MTVLTMVHVQPLVGWMAVFYKVSLKQQVQRRRLIFIKASWVCLRKPWFHENRGQRTFHSKYK